MLIYFHIDCYSNLFTHQGGLSDGYKKHIAETELPDITYTEDGLALFRVQGSGPENMQAIQVEPVSPAYSLPSNFLSFPPSRCSFQTPQHLCFRSHFLGFSHYFVISHELDMEGLSVFFLFWFIVISLLVTSLLATKEVSASSILIAGKTK